jgi:transcriptional regulator with GAF, ATPase, and Fis domain
VGELRAQPKETSGETEISGTRTTVVEKAGCGAAGEGVQLLVLEPSGLAIYPLPDSGTIAIGRAEDCHVQLRDALASRRHATLHVQPLAIEDNGSANGCKIDDRPIVSGVAVPIRLGQAVFIGNSLLIVRRRGAGDSLGAKSDRIENVTRVASDRPAVVCQPAMVQLYEVVERLARGSINVLVLGETGVGKEVVAESIHRASPRCEAPLVRINCAALAEPLLESELFGHERGAFTGAVSAKPGLLEVAHGGTVFLDEVGELPASLQAKLLRVIEAREVTRVGGLRPRPNDVRFVSATNRDLEADVARGAFRADLMFRLNGASLEVPPLRQRPLEILPLAELFLSRVADQIRFSRPPRLTEEAVALLLAYAWPGNVRELRNVIECAVLLSAGASIGPNDLSLGQRLVSTPMPRSMTPLTTIPVRPDDEEPTRATLTDDAEIEREKIAHALLECGGNQSRAAKFLGVPRRTLVRKIAQLGLPRPRGSNG